MVASTHRDAKGASPLSTGARGDPLTSGADAPALGFVSQRESVAQARARFGRGEQCSTRPRAEHTLSQSEMKPAGPRGRSARSGA